MFNPLKRVRKAVELVVLLPQQLRLAYCLARDPRTPTAPKAALAGALALILNPFIDIPMWIPVVGQMDAIALTVLAVRTYNRQAPAALRIELEAQIKAGTSQFDRDLAAGVGSARQLAELATRLPQLALRRRPGDHSRVAPQPAAWYRSPDAAGGEAEGSVSDPPTGSGPSDH